MRFLELRRHSIRVPGTDHLSPQGVALARRVGACMGPFARVISSPSSWTYETAIAMGFAVDEQYAPVPLLDSEWERLGELMPPGTPFAARLEPMQRNALAKRLADALRAQWNDYASAVPDHGCFLVVTHSGYIDNSAVACLPSARHELWGDNFRHCEGIRLAFDAARFVSGKVIRVA
jgi:broad specificity phosphatase PhoE